MLLTLSALAGVLNAAPAPVFEDATDAVGLGGLSAARVCFVDLNADGRPDVVIDRALVFLNRAGEGGSPHFEPVATTGLPEVRKGDVLVFADLDNDGFADAILGRSNDVHAETYEAPPEGTPQVSCWVPGHGDGTFGAFHEFPVEPRTTSAVSVGDADLDGRLDVYLGNWYVHYGEGYEAYPNDLLLQTSTGVFVRAPLPTDGVAFDEDNDAGGRPTYGVVIADLLTDGRPGLLDLNYGRRANRYMRAVGTPGSEGAYHDEAPTLGVDADDIRHGHYDDWVKEKIEGLEDEKPFRANGNTFDASVCDVDNDRDLDLFIATIRHAWAGESSDVSRLLIQGPDGRFTCPPERQPPRDREPPDHWNLGDLFCHLADLDQDGRVDLLISSGDYPDDQRLRVFRQTDSGTFESVTSESGIDHDGSQQLSLADVDLDGDLDILVGQTFFRYSKEQKAGREPRVNLFLNRASERGLGHALDLRLIGDGVRANRDAIGTLVRVTADTDADPATPPVTMTRLLAPIGGHAGKQMGFDVHVGLGQATEADRVEVVWPTADPRAVTTLEHVEMGRHTVRMTQD